jgi:PAS domain S-box-containing protein
MGKKQEEWKQRKPATPEDRETAFSQYTAVLKLIRPAMELLGHSLDAFQDILPARKFSLSSNDSGQTLTKLADSEKRYGMLVKNTFTAVMLCKVQFDYYGKPVDLIINSVDRNFEALLSIRSQDLPLSAKDANAPELAHKELLAKFANSVKTDKPRHLEVSLGRLGKVLALSVYHLNDNCLVVVCRDKGQYREANVELAYFTKLLEDWLKQNVQALQDGLAGLKENTVRRRKAQTQLKKLSKVFMDSTDPIIIENMQHTIVDLNTAAENVYGYSHEELIGRSVTCLIPENRRTFAMDLRRRCIGGETIHDWEGVRQDRTGAPHPALITAFILRGNDGKPESIATIARNISSIKSMQHEIKQRARQLSRLSSEQTLAQQRERHRLAKTLHDNLQQLLAGAKLKLEIFAAEPLVRDHTNLKSALELVVESLKISRALATELSPPVLFQQGLANALSWLARQTHKNHGLTIDLTLDKRAEPEQEELKILLFESVRELLFNIVKHAETKSAAVELKYDHDRVKITVCDKGVGFNPQKLWGNTMENGGGFGLFNIRERLQLLGGTFQIKSRVGKGTAATLTSPLKSSTYNFSKVKPSKVKMSFKPPSFETPRPSFDQGRGKIRVMLVDDHAVMRDGLSAMLARHHDIEIAGEASNGEEAVGMVGRIRPDVILMDINMPKVDGIEATRRIHTEFSEIQIIGLSMYEADDQAELMAAAGAVGYLNKAGSSKALLRAIRDAAKS